MEDELKNNDYDSEPIFYCARCYSLKIRYEEAIQANYCANCGCSDILEGDIHEWEKLYELRYNKKFVTPNRGTNGNPIFKASIKELKRFLFGYSRYKEIIGMIYQKFPKNMSHSDLVLWFFDQLIQDKKIEALKQILFKKNIVI